MEKEAVPSLDAFLQLCQMFRIRHSIKGKLCVKRHGDASTTGGPESPKGVTIVARLVRAG